jgi:hypothetical protein
VAEGELEEVKLMYSCGNSKAVKEEIGRFEGRRSDTRIRR